MKNIVSSLKPRRIAAVPNIVLDVVVDTPVTDSVGVTSHQVRQLALQPAPLQDDDSAMEVEAASQDVISTPSATSTLITTTATSTPNAMFSYSTESLLGASSTATSSVRQSSVYGI